MWSKEIRQSENGAVALQTGVSQWSLQQKLAETAFGPSLKTLPVPQ